MEELPVGTIISTTVPLDPGRSGRDADQRRQTHPYQIVCLFRAGRKAATSIIDHRTVSKGGTMRWIAVLLLMGMAHAALASGPPTFDKFQSAVESKGAPPEGTFFTTGKFKSLCTCLDHTGDVGVIESSTSTMGTNVLVTSVCVLSAFNATTGAIATQALCDTWAPITKP
jgi:hypothetical protein